MKKVIFDCWLTKLLGKNVYYFHSDKIYISLSDLPRENYFIWTKAPVNNISLIKHLHNLGFCIIDTNIKLFLEKKLDIYNTGYNVRFAKIKDEYFVREIASNAFMFNRFQLDPQISNEIANKIKEEWAGNFFSGNRGRWMIVAEYEGKVVGFNQILSKNNDTIVIDLIAVHPSFRGKGLAKAMISFASKKCINIPVKIEVGTQISNVESLNLYTKLGFNIRSSNYVLHMHK